MHSAFRRREGKQDRTGGKIEQECDLIWRLALVSIAENMNCITELVSLRSKGETFVPTVIRSLPLVQRRGHLRTL